MLSLAEIKFLKNPEQFNANYRYSMTHRLNFKVKALQEEIFLLQTSGFLNLTESNKNLTEFRKIIAEDSNNQIRNQGNNCVALSKWSAEDGIRTHADSRVHGLSRPAR
jgi:thermostable 8-oxoguanine DNA glycosylase